MSIFSKKYLFFGMTAFAAASPVFAMNTSSTARGTIHCSGEGEEFSLSQGSDRSFFVASWAAHPAADLASQLTRALRYGWSATSMVLQVPSYQACQLIDTDDSIGIETVTCHISNGALLTIDVKDGGKRKVRLKGGTVAYHRNIYYAGQVSLSVTLTTEEGHTVSASRTLPADVCTSTL